MKMRHVLLTAVLLLGMLLFSSGCATSVAFDVVKPAEITMSEYSHLAVFEIEPYEFSMMDFAGSVFVNLLFGREIDQPTGFSPFLEQDIANEFEKQIIYQLQKSKYFTIIPPSQLRPYQGSSKTGAYLRDVLINEFSVTASLIGSIDNVRFNEQVLEEEIVIPAESEGDGGEGEGESEPTIVIEKSLLQEVSLEFSYSILDVRKNKIIAVRSFQEEARRRTRIGIEDEDEDSFRAPSLFSLYQTVISSIAGDIRNQLVPRTVHEVRFLEKDTQRDPKMDQAEKLVKAGSWNQALDMYLQVWRRTANYAAGYNAVILYEVKGDLNKAIKLMEEVYRKTGNPKAGRKLEQLQMAVEEYSQAMEQIR
jgi:hypothetical protein